MKQAKNELSMLKRRTILFMDEVHRFNKGQQDAFLPHIESGLGKINYRRYRGAAVRKRSKDKREMMVLKEKIGKESKIRGGKFQKKRVKRGTKVKKKKSMALLFAEIYCKL